MINIKEKIKMIPLIIKNFKYNFLENRHMLFKDFKYGDNRKNYYRVYDGEDKEKPIIYFIHGGGWWHGTPKVCNSIAKFFCKRGYTVVLPSYRLVPKYKYPTQIEDVFLALSKYLNESYNIKGIVVMGFSAGAELSANIVFNKKMQQKYNVDNNIFKGFISLSGVLDFNECNYGRAKKLVYNYIGDGSYGDKNPINLIKNNKDVPVLCLHGDKDPLISINNSFNFVKELEKCNGKGRVKIVKDKYHSDMISLIIGKGEKDSKEIFKFMDDIIH